MLNKLKKLAAAAAGVFSLASVPIFGSGEAQLQETSLTQRDQTVLQVSKDSVLYFSDAVPALSDARLAHWSHSSHSSHSSHRSHYSHSSHSSGYRY